MASKPQRDREIAAMESVYRTLNLLRRSQYAGRVNTVGAYTTGGDNAARRVLEYVADRLGYKVEPK